jgi:nucleotide-binding universal stress UspA family protein
MIRFTRILFPADLSSQSREAAPFVAAMVSRFQSELFILHVLEPLLSYYPLSAAAMPTAVMQAEEARKTRQSEFASFISNLFRGVSVQPCVLEGDAADRIATCAQDNKVDLIMMPTHGYGRLRRLLLGSVTAKVLHDAACPVWTGVHTDEMWSQTGARWNRFLCAVSDDPRDTPLLKWAAQFASEQHAELQVIHAVHATPPNPGGEPYWLPDFLMGLANENLAKLQAGAGTKFDIKLGLGPVDHVVRQAALEHRADLILIGRGAIQTGMGRLRSSVYSVIREAPCPVISL